MNATEGMKEMQNPPVNGQSILKKRFNRNMKMGVFFLTRSRHIPREVR